MVRYHDEEWGVPLHDDQRPLRAADPGGRPGRPELGDHPQAPRRLSPRLRGLRHRPHRRLRTTPTSQRLLADSGIIRNRAKISGDHRQRAAPRSRSSASSARLDAYVWGFVDGQTQVNHSASRWRDVPAKTPESRGDEQGAAQARLSLRRPDDLLRLHAVRRASSTTTSPAASEPSCRNTEAPLCHRGIAVSASRLLTWRSCKHTFLRGWPDGLRAGRGDYRDRRQQLRHADDVDLGSSIDAGDLLLVGVCQADTADSWPDTVSGWSRFVDATVFASWASRLVQAHRGRRRGQQRRGPVDQRRAAGERDLRADYRLVRRPRWRRGGRRR